MPKKSYFSSQNGYFCPTETSSKRRGLYCSILSQLLRITNDTLYYTEFYGALLIAKLLHQQDICETVHTSIRSVTSLLAKIKCIDARDCTPGKVDEWASSLLLAVSAVKAWLKTCRPSCETFRSTILDASHSTY